MCDPGSEVVASARGSTSGSLFPPPPHDDDTDPRRSAETKSARLTSLCLSRRRRPVDPPAGPRQKSETAFQRNVCRTASRSPSYMKKPLLILGAASLIAPEVAYAADGSTKIENIPHV